MPLNFKDHINNNLSFLLESKILIAISGGIDSVVLTHLCHKLELNIALAHCNFNLREEESDADEAFVMQLAEDLNLEVFIQNFDTNAYAQNNKLSTQMAARELRYHWFRELASQLAFDYILTAHHADDNLETFLINLSRGTGIDGLTGIPEINDNIVRPLLPFSRKDIQNYAQKTRLNWSEDSSNTSTKYLRNKLRLEVIPILKETIPQLLQNIDKSQKHLQDSKDIIEDRIDAISNLVISDISEGGISFDIDQIKALNNPKAYLYQLLSDYGFTEWNDILKLLNAQTGKQVFSKTHRLLRNRDQLILCEISSEDDGDMITINKEQKKINTPFGVLLFDEADALFGKRTNVIHVEKDLLKFPLTIRKWEEGDFFYPSGMKGRKKLSKYFKDEKMSLIDKENVWLLCSSQNAIIWIINRRADNRFEATKDSKQVLKITLEG